MYRERWGGIDVYLKFEKGAITGMVFEKKCGSFNCYMMSFRLLLFEPGNFGKHFPPFPTLLNQGSSF